MGWEEYSPSIFCTGEGANLWLLAQQWDPWEDEAGKWSPAMDIPLGSYARRFPIISDTNTTAVGTPCCFVMLGLQKRQSRATKVTWGLENKRSFAYLGFMANRQPTHKKQRCFLCSQHLNESKITQTSYINLPLSFIVTSTVSTWHSSQLNTAIYFAILTPPSLQYTGHLSKRGYI